MPFVNVQIDQERLTKDIDRMAAYSDAPAPAVTRIIFTPTELAARAFIRQQMREAGLTVREDGVGNIFGRWFGDEAELPPVATGSHIDAVPYSGRFDGVVGVLGGLEAIRALKRGKYQPRRSIELIMFSSEEPTRFGIGCLGSRALAGSLLPEHVRQLKDGNNLLFDDLRRSAGYQQPLAQVRLEKGTYDSFVELHIEQGPRLEEANMSIGVVTSIAAPATLRVAVHGEGGHAGAVLMPGRRDALAAASEIILAVEQAAFSTGRRDSVATVGLLEIHPGAVNSIPQNVIFEIDIRDITKAPRDSMVAFIRAAIEKIEKKRDVTTSIQVIHADPPSQSDEKVSNEILKACEKVHLEPLKMVSRAYHDTLFMAQICPTAMIFIPSRGGYSHRPEEYSSPLQIQRGVTVLAQTLVGLSSS